MPEEEIQTEVVETPVVGTDVVEEVAE